MSDESIHRQSYTIRDTTVRSVTIYPQRAAVVRDVENIILKVRPPCTPHPAPRAPS